MVISEQGCRQSRRSSMGQHEATSRSSVLGSGCREPTRNAGTKKKGKKQSRDARGLKAGTLTRFNLHTPLGHSRSLDASRRVSAEAASWSREEAIAHRRDQCRQSADDEGELEGAIVDGVGAACYEDTERRVHAEGERKRSVELSGRAAGELLAQRPQTACEPVLVVLDSMSVRRANTARRVPASGLV